MNATRLLIHFASAVLLFTTLDVRAARETVVPKWGRFEQEFQSSVRYTNALQQARLTVVFMSPFGETNRVDGFWDGGTTWRVRYSPDMPGKWGWATICSDRSNTGLHMQSGTFTCTAPSGKSRFDEHGPVRVARGAFHLEHADATPFFWLADTTWNGALLSTPADWQKYLQTRARQKFSAVQWVATQWRAAPTGDAQGQLAFTGREKIAVNPEFFQRLDAKADAVNNAGMLNVPVLLWAIGKGSNPGVNPGYGLAEDQAILLARYMVARWQAHDVAWILAGDGHYFGGEGAKWKRIGKAVFGEGPHAPVIMHPQGHHWIQPEFRDERWMDIVGYQSGHGDSDESLQWLTRGPLTQDWNAEPHRPVINLEPPYEGHLGYHSKRPISGEFVRRSLYWSLLNGPTAGVSYGAHGVWGWDDGTKPPIDHPNSGVPSSWQNALTIECAEQMTNLVSFFTQIDFTSLRPAPEAVVNNPGNQSARKYIAAARSVSKDVTLVYVPDERTVEILLDALPPSPEVKWFNPRTGETSAAVAVVTDRTAQFPTPSEGDWILWMHTQKK